MNTQTPSLIIDGIIIPVAPHAEHEYTLTTAQVAHGYEISQSQIREHKKQHSDELIEGKHFSSVCLTDAGNLQRVTTIWTKRGIIRLGFFIRSERAKRFRDMAEDLCLREWDQPEGDLNTLILTELRALRAEVTEVRAEIAQVRRENSNALVFATVPAPETKLFQDPDERDFAKLVRCMAHHIGFPVSFVELAAIARAQGLFRGKLQGKPISEGRFQCSPTSRSTLGWIFSRHNNKLVNLENGETAIFRAWGTNRQRRFYAEIPEASNTQIH